MPNTLPVPSKAALRTLRILALGTSCTVAFTTGLLTEDRRRRICAAKEVLSNAQKIRSSRNYHSGGALSIDSFEDRVSRYKDDGVWQTKDSPFNIQPEHTTPSLETKIPEYPSPPQYRPDPPRISRSRKFSGDYTLRFSTRRLKQPASTDQQDSLIFDVAKSVEDKDEQPAFIDRQERLALDVTKLLEDKEGKSNIEAAASRFFDAFDEGIPDGGYGLTKNLIGAAAQLSKAYQIERQFSVSWKILDIVLRYGPIDQRVFNSLGAEAIITNFLSGIIGNEAGSGEIEASMLRKAAALYLTKFDEKPGTVSDSWRSLGEALCSITCRYGLLDLTEALYFRIGQGRGDAPDDSFQYLMTALHKQERYKNVFQRFKRFAANASLCQSSFRTVGDIVIESTLKIRRPDKAEEALGILSRMSEERGVWCSTTWVLKVLGDDWRTYQDITRTRALFERLTPIHGTFDSVAIYSAMIQICIEAGDEAAARLYHASILKSRQKISEYLELKIHGHFAYAKALRNEWTGVKEDFRSMREFLKMRDYSKVREYSTIREMNEHLALRKLRTNQDGLSAAFTPIFKLFAKSHPVNETEEFLRTFIDHHYVVLTPYMSTSMINKYAEAKEIDSISRWLDYMVSVQSSVDSMFFNAILNNCPKKWRFSFDETYHLYLQVKGMGDLAKKFINKDTISILRRVAMAGARRNVSIAVENLNRLKLEQPLRISVDSISIQEQMKVALTKGDPQRALRIYERAQRNLVPLYAPCATTAVKASLQANPNDIFAATSLLQKPMKDGLNISSAVAMIFMHQLSCHSHDRTNNRLQEVARKTLSVLEDRGITILPQAITHTMHILVRQGKYHEAIDFWGSMSSSQNAPAPLDIRSLTVFLQAYIALQDCIGVEWVVQKVSTNGLVPDERFKRALVSAQRETRKLLTTNEHSDSIRQFSNALKEALKIVLAICSDAREEKEDVKIMTIKIMERAIEFEKSSVLEEKAEKMSERALLSQPDAHEHEKRSVVPSEEEIGACSWMESDDRSNYAVYVPPGGRLVGVNAG